MKRYTKALPIILMLIMFVAGHTNGQERDFRLYGFFDMEAKISNKDAAGKNWTFDQHHFNLLFDFRIDDRIRVCSEMEWEHGAVLGGGDDVGEIYLAKAYLEYRFSERFQLRVGKFLTPFGIYNERHDATPTFTSTTLPASVYSKRVLSPYCHQARLFAKEGAGIQLIGTFQPNDWLLRYQTYLTNGRGDAPFEKDNNANKAVGGRVTIAPPSTHGHIGFSFFRERSTINHNAVNTLLGLEAEYDIATFHLEAEAIISSIEAIDSLYQPIGGHYQSEGAYALVSYTLFDRLTPFVRYDYYKPGWSDSYTQETKQTIGMNFSVTDRVFLKSEIIFNQTNMITQDHNYRSFIMSIAAAL